LIHKSDKVFNFPSISNVTPKISGQHTKASSVVRVRRKTGENRKTR